MPNTTLQDLLRRYFNNETTELQQDELFAMIEDPANEGSIMEVMDEVWDTFYFEQKIFDAAKSKAILGNIQKIRLISRKSYTKKWWRVAVAASIILLLSIGSYFMFFNKEKQTEVVKTTVPNDVKAPQTNRAMITLANGQQVYLDSVGNGVLAKQGNIQLVKLRSGQISYERQSGEIIKELQYNTLSNPRGSKVIDMTLSDGSHVWLNAGSSVTYPVSFIGDERKVSMTGEAYFDVAHDPTKPFYVSKSGVSVEVLGTHFNVNAYDDEAEIKVTLLEGSIKINQGNANSFLKPGEQALITNSIHVLNSVDVEKVMAWKAGLFSFDQSDLQMVMRQIARWYDLEVVYEGKIPERRFGGEISRMNNVSKVLRVLEESQVKFRIEGRKIIVVKQ